MSDVATPTTGWRRLAGATWRSPNDPQFYGELGVDATAVLAYVNELRSVHGVRVTVTHAIDAAVARVFAGTAPTRTGMTRRPNICEIDGGDSDVRARRGLPRG